MYMYTRVRTYAYAKATRQRRLAIDRRMQQGLEDNNSDSEEEQEQSTSDTQVCYSRHITCHSRAKSYFPGIAH